MYTPNCGYFEIVNGFSKCYLYDQNASCTAPIGVGKDTFGVYSGSHPAPTPPSPAPHPHPGPSPAPPTPSGPVGPPGPTDADSIVIAISDPRAGPVSTKVPDGLSPALVLSGVTVQEAAMNSFHTHYAPAYCSMNVTAKGALLGNFENKCAKAGGMCLGMSARASESLVAWCLTKP